MLRVDEAHALRDRRNYVGFVASGPQGLDQSVPPPPIGSHEQYSGLFCGHRAPESYDKRGAPSVTPPGLDDESTPGPGAKKDRIACKTCAFDGPQPRRRLGL